MGENTTAAILQVMARLHDDSQKTVTKEMKSMLNGVEKNIGAIPIDATIDDKNLRDEIAKLIKELSGMMSKGIKGVDFAKQFSGLLSALDSATAQSADFADALDKVQSKMTVLNKISEKTKLAGHFTEGDIAKVETALNEVTKAEQKRADVSEEAEKRIQKANKVSLKSIKEKYKTETEYQEYVKKHGNTNELLRKSALKKSGMNEKQWEEASIKKLSSLKIKRDSEEKYLIGTEYRDLIGLQKTLSSKLTGTRGLSADEAEKQLVIAKELEVVSKRILDIEKEIQAEDTATTKRIQENVNKLEVRFADLGQRIKKTLEVETKESMEKAIQDALIKAENVIQTIHNRILTELGGTPGGGSDSGFVDSMKSEEKEAKKAKSEIDKYLVSKEEASKMAKHAFSTGGGAPYNMEGSNKEKIADLIGYTQRYISEGGRLSDLGSQIQRKFEMYTSGAKGSIEVLEKLAKKVREVNEQIDNSANTDSISLDTSRSIEDQIEEYDQKIRELSDKLEDINSKYTESQDTVSDLNKKLEGAVDKDEYESIATNLKTAKEEAESLRQVLETANNSLENFKKGQVSIIDFEKAQEDIAKYEKDLNNLKTLVDTYKNDMKAMKDTIDSLKSENKELSSKIPLNNQAGTDVEKLKSDLAEANKKLNEQKELWEAASKEADRANATYLGVRNVLDDCLDKYDSFKNSPNFNLESLPAKQYQQYLDSGNSEHFDKAAGYLGIYGNLGGTKRAILDDGTDVTNELLARFKELKEEKKQLTSLTHEELVNATSKAAQLKEEVDRLNDVVKAKQEVLATLRAELDIERTIAKEAEANAKKAEKAKGNANTKEYIARKELEKEKAQNELLKERLKLRQQMGGSSAGSDATTDTNGELSATKDQRALDGEVGIKVVPKINPEEFVSTVQKAIDGKSVQVGVEENNNANVEKIANEQIADQKKVVSVQEKIIEQLREIAGLRKALNEGNERIVPRKFSDSRSSMIDSSDVTKASGYKNTTQASVKRVLKSYQNELADTDHSTENSKKWALERLAAYTYAYGDLTKAEEIYGKKNKAIFDQVVAEIEKAKLAMEAFSDTGFKISDISHTINEATGKNMSFGDSNKIEELLDTKGVDEAYKYLESKFNLKDKTLEESTKTTSKNTDSEKTSFDELGKKVDDVTSSIDLKTEAIKKEEEQVESSVVKEIAKFDSLLKKIQEIEDALNALAAAYSDVNNTAMESAANQISDVDSVSENLKELTRLIDTVVNNEIKVSLSSENIDYVKEDLQSLKATITEISKGLKLQPQKLSIEPKINKAEWKAQINDALKNIKLQKVKLELDATAVAKAQKEVAKKSGISRTMTESDLNRNSISKSNSDIPQYFSKVFNSVSSMSDVVAKKFTDKGFTNVAISGVEELDGRVKALRVTATDTSGAIKNIVYELAKIEGKKNPYLVAKDDVSSKDSNLADIMAKGREKSQLKSDKDSKTSVAAQAKAINKSLDDKYKFINKIADRREQAQIKSANLNKKSEENQAKAINKALEKKYIDEQKMLDEMAKKREAVEAKAIQAKKKAEEAQAKAANKAIEDNYKQQVANDLAKAKQQEKDEQAISKLRENGQKKSMDYVSQESRLIEESMKKRDALLTSSQESKIKSNIGSVSLNEDGKVSTYSSKVNELNTLFNEMKNVIREVDTADTAMYDEAMSKVTAYKKQISDMVALLNSDQMNIQNDMGKNAGTIVSDGDIADLNIANKKVEELLRDAKLVEKIKFNPSMGEWIAQIENADGKIESLKYTFESSSKSIRRSITSITNKTTVLGKFIDSLKGKFLEVARYLLSFVGIFEIWNAFKQGVEIVKELDSALIEMKKVSKDSAEALEEFANASHKVAQNIGSTAVNIQNSAADWMRLGYSIKEAGKLAENTTILMNVSEFEEIGDATESMVAMIQAFKDDTTTVEDLSSQIIDKLNNIGNNYAISTSDLAESLKRSSSSLIAAGKQYCLNVQKCA